MFLNALLSFIKVGILIEVKKVFYTHITRGEQGAIGLRHVHVVVVILEL